MTCRCVYHNAEFVLNAPVNGYWNTIFRTFQGERVGLVCLSTTFCRRIYWGWCVQKIIVVFLNWQTFDQVVPKEKKWTAFWQGEGERCTAASLMVDEMKTKRKIAFTSLTVDSSSSFSWARHRWRTSAKTSQRRCASICRTEINEGTANHRDNYNHFKQWRLSK